MSTPKIRFVIHEYWCWHKTNGYCSSICRIFSTKTGNAIWYHECAGNARSDISQTFTDICYYPQIIEHSARIGCREYARKVTAAGIKWKSREEISEELRKLEDCGN